jgi:CHAT domain-containing protein
MAQEHYDEAIDRFTAALHLSQRLGTQSSIAKALGNIGWSYKELGDFDNALDSYKQAEEASARSGLVGDRLYWLTGISNVYYHQHDYFAAENVLTQALNLARKQDDKSIVIEYLNDLSEIALENGQTDLAERYYKEVSEVERTGADLPGVVASLLVCGRIEQNKRNFPAAKDSFLKVIADANADKAEKWEAQGRLAQVYADDGQSANADTEFRRSLKTIETVRSSVQAEDLRMSFLSGGIDFYDGYVAFLISQGRTQDALEVAELSRARTLAEGLGMAPQTLSFPLRDFHPRRIALRSNATLLFYWLGQKKSYLWVITPRQVNCLTLPGATKIDPLVKSYSDAVLSGRDVLAAGNAHAANLYKVLIEPANKLIPPNSRVILLPDGSLYGLNFEALLVPDPKPHFWIEDVTLSTASSLTLLSATRPYEVCCTNVRMMPTASTFGRDSHQNPRPTFTTGNLLLVGNATPAVPEFPVLRQADTEMAGVERYFAESRREVLAGLRATPSAYLASDPEKFAYIHFVAHGTASRAHPLDSAVILSPEGNSYKLYARDIVKHRLSAYLVTISACNGSGTRAYSGEGLVGLSWAFLRAGAGNVIAALWEVNDVSTPQLMNHLYAELVRSHDPAASLRAAKLALLRSDSVFKKPFYWAPFQLYSGS